MTNLAYFRGGCSGPWRIVSVEAVRGETLPCAERLEIVSCAVAEPAHPVEASSWTLKGVAGHARYATRRELDMLGATQAPLGRGEATCAALIPIRKSQGWWTLAQDERRIIFEETSHHTAIGTAYLPAVARRLHHCRDLGEPFDFLTWFEFAPEHAAAFDALVAALRATPEWGYVEREVDIRLAWDPAASRQAA
ncbi:chlorite dismutase family protein [Methylobacterium nonmethylotrophicum]|uniref:Chlorite dismutase n=1 Tax=Methylobacterium nonmethylotrophicum TaxID=1141884 RepID=A0A4Z0NGL3_9HYPH|nr:chlorite dismutase family protein [Methylobacterium nonmethylotrophicum]TGD95107.1 chlorite dismutase [Methylobacterium nonmethylotrophicum]